MRRFEKAWMLIIPWLILTGCSVHQEDVNVIFSIPAFNKTNFQASSFPVGTSFTIMLSCAGEGMVTVVKEFPVDLNDKTTGYEFTMKVATGKSRHFSAMLYAAGTDPSVHPKTYFLAGDGYFDIYQSKQSVELSMIYLYQSGYNNNIFIDSRDRVWFAVNPVYLYENNELIIGTLSPGGIGVFDGLQWFFAQVDTPLHYEVTSADGNDEKIWLGSSEGVFEFNVPLMQFTDFYDVDITKKIPFASDYDDYAYQVMVKRYRQGAGSEIWFLMSGGIAIYDLISGRFSVIKDSIGNYYNFIAEDPTQSRLFAGKDNGLYAFDWNSNAGTWELNPSVYLANPQTDTLSMHFEKDVQDASVPDKWITGYDTGSTRDIIYHSRDLSSDPTQPGNYFYLTGAGGLTLNGIGYHFFNYDITDSNTFGAIVYFGSSAGLIVHDKSSGAWSLLEEINSFLLSNYVRGIRLTSSGEAWFTCGSFPTVLPAGVMDGYREIGHPQFNYFYNNGKSRDILQITSVADWVPYGIAITGDGQRIYTGGRNYPGGNGWIAEINLNNKTVSQIPLDATASPYIVRLSPDGTNLYASDSPGKKLWVVDLATKTSDSHTLTFSPFRFEISADGTKGHFLNDTAPYSLKIVDLATWQESNIPLTGAGGVNDMAISSDETAVYVSDQAGRKIFKVDLSNNTAREFYVFQSATFSPEKLLLDEENNLIISTGLYNSNNTIVAIPIADPASYIVGLTFSSPANDMLITRDKAMIFLTYSDFNYFHVIDAKNLYTLRADPPLSNDYKGGPMVSSPDGRTVYAITYTPGGAAGWELYLEVIR
ncbi:MAG TPA: hypothetical protein VII00_06640 [bacterium]